MRLSTFGEVYGSRVEAARPIPPEASVLGRIAGEVLEMAAAYRSDGCTFIRTGDRVNALASFTYGLGWLDAGCVLGLVRTAGGERLHPAAIADPIPEALADRLHEKTTRYERMLSEAITAVEAGPDRASLLSEAAEMVVAEARRGHLDGSLHLRNQEYAAALALFSYGYGWLDAGVRAGLLRVTGRRDLFTV